MIAYVVQGCSGSEAESWSWNVAVYLDADAAAMHAELANGVVDEARVIAKRDGYQATPKTNPYDPSQDRLDLRTWYSVDEVELREYLPEGPKPEESAMKK